MPERSAKFRSMRRLASRFPLYPLVFASVFPLHLYESNFDIFPFDSVLRSLGILVLATLALMLLLAGATRKMHQGGIGATLVIYLLLFNENVGLFVTKLLEQSVAWRFLPEITSLAAMAAASALAISFWRNARTTQILNASAAAVLVYHLLVMGSIGMRGPPPADGDAAETGQFAGAVAGGQSPNIFHIVLDGYPRKDVLAEVYGVDNTAFIGRLEGLGFAVAERAVTPYNQTLAVMNSVFFGRYLSDATVRPGLNQKEYREALSIQLQRNPVTAAFSAMGYTIAANQPDYPPVGQWQADLLFNDARANFTAFERTLIEQTFLRETLENFGLRDDSATTIRETFAIPFWRDVRSPFFAYVHVIAPHPPFDVDRNGNPREQSRHGLGDASVLHAMQPRLQLEYRNGYVEKLLFTNAEVYGYIETILRDVPDPKIIVVHGDHGGGLFMDHDDANATCSRERYSPLLAVYSSDGALQNALPADMNLINLYRLVFNTYFQTDMLLLANQSFFLEKQHPARRTRITPEMLLQTCPTDFVPQGALAKSDE